MTQMRWGQDKMKNRKIFGWHNNMLGAANRVWEVMCNFYLSQDEIVDRVRKVGAWGVDLLHQYRRWQRPKSGTGSRPQTLIAREFINVKDVTWLVKTEVTQAGASELRTKRSELQRLDFHAHWGMEAMSKATFSSFFHTRCLERDCGSSVKLWVNMRAVCVTSWLTHTPGSLDDWLPHL